jgi:hypothetical protein
VRPGVQYKETFVKSTPTRFLLVSALLIMLVVSASAPASTGLASDAVQARTKILIIKVP